MKRFFKFKLSNLMGLMAVTVIPLMLVAFITSGENIRVVSDQTLGEEIKHQIRTDKSFSDIISSSELTFRAVRSVTLPGAQPGKAEFSLQKSGVAIVQFRGLKSPYRILKITVIYPNGSMVVYDADSTSDVKAE